jgi:sulfate adenylyltransferase (ADP) / ATP adenylyltransferase
MSETLPSTSTVTLKPGSLWSSVIARSQSALQSGALHPISTTCEWMEQNRVKFAVRILTNLIRKDQASQQQRQKETQTGKDFNPFLPYETDLFVADISPTHLCLLNKFNVVDHHLLIVTRAFEDQENWLTLPDFEALWACMAEFEGLAFYNGGKLAGASQRHKHLQLLPLPIAPQLTPQSVKVPVESVLANAEFKDEIGTIPDLPYVHAFVRLNLRDLPPLEAATRSLTVYFKMLHAVGICADSTPNSIRQTAPYNLLATQDWMLLIPRSQEDFDSISVNSLGFAGTLLVRNEEQLNHLKAIGPMTLLQQVGIAR